MSYGLNVYEDKFDFYRLRIAASTAYDIIKKYDNNINEFYKLIEKLYIPESIQHITSMDSRAMIIIGAWRMREMLFH